MKSIVGSGVSTGIGYGTVAEMCRRGYKVFGSVRDARHGKRLEGEFGDAFTALHFDVTDVEAISRAAAAFCSTNSTVTPSVRSAAIAARI